MEAEVRATPYDLLCSPPPTEGLGSRVHARFEGIEGDGLKAPERQDHPRFADFGE